jgi:carbamoyl-phosphate synthase large subunit
MNKIRVLVTGAGSGVGQGIIKALNICSLEVEIISADIAPLNAALYRTDESLLIPKVEDNQALEKMIDIISRNAIDIVMIGSEFDLCFFAKNKEVIEKQTKALVFASPIETVEISNDKWKTYEFLKRNNLPYAESFLPKDLDDTMQIADDLQFPIILKTRTGTSNRHVHLVDNKNDLIHLYPTVPNPMLQQVIQTPKEYLDCEYTCSIFKTKNGAILGPFTARRTLKGGSSWIVEVDNYEKLYPLLLKIGESLPTLGTLNIQLMVSDKGPIPFEFNARFSGTTAIRANFGFNEPEMVLRSFFLNEKISQPQIRKGVVLRYLEEVFLEGTSVQDLKPPFPKGKIQSWF